jgi:hypothetical protein
LRAQRSIARQEKLDCFVASLRAMTWIKAELIYADARQKEGPPERAFEKSSWLNGRDQAVLV